MIVFLGGGILTAALAAGQSPEEPMITVRMAVTNPCDRAVSNTFYWFSLPDGVTKADVLDLGGLSILTNDWASRSNIFVGRTIDLAPRERQVFSLAIRDVWFIPDDRAMEVRRKYKETLLSLDALEREHGVPQPDEPMRSIRQCSLAEVAEFTESVPSEVHTNYDRHVGWHRDISGLEQSTKLLQNMLDLYRTHPELLAKKAKPPAVYPTISIEYEVEEH